MTICSTCTGNLIVCRPHPQPCPVCRPTSHVLEHEAHKTRTSAASFGWDSELSGLYTLAGHQLTAAAEGLTRDSHRQLDLIAEGAVMYDLAGRRDLGRAMIHRFGYTDRRVAMVLPVPDSWMDVDELAQWAEMPGGVQ